MRHANVIPKVFKPMAASIRPEPKDTARIVEDMRKDATFRLGMFTLQAMAAKSVVSFEVNGKDPKAEIVSKNVQRLWEDHAFEMMEFTEFGRQAFEIVYRQSDDVTTIKSLIPVGFTDSELKIDKETGFHEYVKVGKGDKAVHLYPRGHDMSYQDGSEYFWLAFNEGPSNPYGTSLYRGAPFQVRQQRKRLDEQEKCFYDRHSMGIGLAIAPEETLGPPVSGDGDKGEVDEFGQPIDNGKKLAEELERLRSGGYMILPSSQYKSEQGGGRKWDITQFPEVKDGGPIQSRRTNLDVAAMRSLGIPERALIQEGQTGAYSLAEAHQTVLHANVEKILRQVVTAFQEQIINNLCRLNDVKGWVRMTWRPLGDQSERRLEQIVMAALQSSTPSPLILENVFAFIEAAESLGIPLGEGAVESLKRIAAKSSAPAPSFGFGGGSLAHEMATELLNLRKAKLFELSSISEGCCS